MEVRSGLAHLLTAADNGVLAIGSCMICYWPLYALVTDHVNGSGPGLNCANYCLDVGL